MPYPHVELLDATESAALMLQGLSGTELPVIYNNNGTNVMIAKIDLSAISIQYLLRVSRLIWRGTPDAEYT